MIEVAREQHLSSFSENIGQVKGGWVCVGHEQCWRRNHKVQLGRRKEAGASKRPLVVSFLRFVLALGLSLLQVSIYIELDGLDACTEDMFQAREHQ